MIFDDKVRFVVVNRDDFLRAIIVWVILIMASFFSFQINLSFIF